MSEFAMPWSSKFRKPIALRDGVEIITLRSAADLLLGLPKRHLSNPHWQHAAELLMAAAAAKSDAPAAEARDQLERALRAEGMT